MLAEIVIKDDGQEIDLDMRGSSLAQVNMIALATCELLHGCKKPEASNETIAEDFKKTILSGLEQLDAQKKPDGEVK